MARRARKIREPKAESPRTQAARRSAEDGRNGSLRKATRLPLSPSLLLVGAALLLAALGGGMLYDRVMPTPGAINLIELIGIPLTMAIVGAALVWAFWVERAQAASSPALRPTSLLFVGFLSWVALSLTRSTYPYVSLTVLALFGASVAIGAVIQCAVRTPEAGFRLITVLAGSPTLVAAFGIREYIEHLLPPYHNVLWRVFGSFVNPDFLAGFLVMTVPLAFALFLAVKEPLPRLLAGIAATLQAVCLVLTQSRLGLIALIGALVVFGVFAVRSGALAGAGQRRALVAVALVLVSVLIAGRPLLRRFLTSGGEAYSAQFRVHTWRGTLAMAKANPLMGTGIGTFETAYPPYAQVGYTQHAHNSFLQFAAEIGLPGALLLLLALGSTGLAGIQAFRPSGVQPAPNDPIPSSLLLAGLLAALTGAIVHNLFDSDLYIPATALTLGAICGLTLALARLSRDERDAPKPAPVAEPSRPSRRAGAIANSLAAGMALLLFGCAFMVGGGRLAANGAAAAYGDAIAEATIGQDARGSLHHALEGYETAAARDPWNPEYWLSLSTLYQVLGQPQAAEQASARAVADAKIGKTFYRYGRILEREGKMKEAAGMYERSRQVEPNNLENLLALADAYIVLGRMADAERIYQHMATLYHSDFEAIRALPEIVDWEYGRAYLGLAEAALQRGDRRAAEANYQAAAAILGQFWKQRDLLISQIRDQQRPEVRNMASDYYDKALAEWANVLDALGDRQKAADVRARRAQFQSERKHQVKLVSP